MEEHYHLKKTSKQGKVSYAYYGNRGVEIQASLSEF